MEIVTSKSLAIMLMILLTLVIGVIPLKLRSCGLRSSDLQKKRKREVITSSLLCFGSGVLLATVFVHMLPEAREGFQSLKTFGQPSRDHHDHSHGEVSRDPRTNVTASYTSGFNVTGIEVLLPEVPGGNHREETLGLHERHLEGHESHGHPTSGPTRLNDSAHQDYDTGDHGHERGFGHADNNGHDTPNHGYDFGHEPGHDHDAVTSAENVTSKNDSGLGSHDDPSSHSHPPTSHGPSAHDHGFGIHDHDHKTVKAMQTPPTGREESKRVVKGKLEGDPQSPNDFGVGTRVRRRVHDDLAEDAHHDDGHDYPYAELCICVGFFLIYLIEELVHKLCLPKESHGCSNNVHPTDVVDHRSVVPAVYHLTTESRKSTGKPGDSGVNGYGTQFGPVEMKVMNGVPNSVCALEGGMTLPMPPKCEWAFTGVANPVYTGDLEATSWNPAVRSTIIATNESPARTRFFGSTSYTLSNGFPKPGDSCGQGTRTPAPNNHSHNDHSHLVDLGKKGFSGNLRSLLIVLALSLHAVFEGLAIGLQERSADVWYLFGAISAHKYVIAFCVGLELAVSASAGTTIVLMFIFSLVTPVGIGIGMIFTKNIGSRGYSHILVVTILQGLAGGTILYVTFLEVLERERAKAGGRMSKFLSLAFGFAMMASLEAFGPHSHAPE